MRIRTYLAGLILVSVIFLAGCTGQTSTTGKIATTFSYKSPEDVVKEYVLLSSVYDTKALDYITGYLKSYNVEMYNFISKMGNIENNFLADFNSVCPKVYDSGKCEKMKEPLLRESAYNITIKYVEELEKHNNTALVKIVYEELFEDTWNVTKKIYYLELSEGQWLIYDVEEDGKLRSEMMPLETLKTDNSEFLSQFKQTLDKALNTLQKVKNDKCGYIEISGFTQTEVLQEKEVCYNGKYINYVKTTKNVTVCNDISDPNYLGRCYATVAMELSNVSICEDVEVIEYDARGYYEPLSSRDVCYYVYNMNTYGKEQGTVCNSITNSQFKEDCKGNYDRGY